MWAHRVSVDTGGSRAGEDAVNEPIAAVVAVCASVAFGASDVIEQRATHTVPLRRPLDPRLFQDLAAKRAWRAGITVDVAASALQAVALHLGPLSLVQPILVCDLLFAALISNVVTRRRPDWVMAAGVVCCSGGLALFLAVARPHGGSAAVSPVIVLPLGAGLAVTVAFCLIAAHAGPRRGRPLATALACGVIFGVTAFLLKEMSRTIPQGFSPPSRQWPLYAFIILEPAGFLLNQNAFQESALIVPVLAIRTVANPVVAIGIGLLWLNERIASGPAGIAAEAAGLVIMTVGVCALAHRSPRLTGPPDRRGVSVGCNDLLRCPSSSGTRRLGFGRHAPAGHDHYRARRGAQAVTDDRAQRRPGPSVGPASGAPARALPRTSRAAPAARSRSTRTGSPSASSSWTASPPSGPSVWQMSAFRAHSATARPTAGPPSAGGATWPGATTACWSRACTTCSRIPRSQASAAAQRNAAAEPGEPSTPTTTRAPPQARIAVSPALVPPDRR